MVVVHRAHGLRFVIYLDDHEPAHVHVFGDAEAKINLTSEDGLPRLVWNRGLTKVDARRALRSVGEHQAMLLARWEEIHG